jgi:hypothetical protein
LRCLSVTDISIPTLFAPPPSSGPQSYFALVDQNGAVEVIWFPFVQDSAWVKIWHPEPVKPASSTKTYAYTPTGAYGGGWT